jgi:hypothetical protein
MEGRGIFFFGGGGVEYICLRFYVSTPLTTCQI